MQVPFFRNFTPGIHILYAFSLAFLGGMFGEAFMYLMRMAFWGNTELNTNPELFSQSDITYYRMLSIVMPIFFFITPALVFSRLMEYEGQDYLAVRKKPSLKPAMIVALILVVCSPISNFLFHLNLQIDPTAITGNETGEMIKHAEQQDLSFALSLLIDEHFSVYLLNLIGVALITAIGEELIFRSVLQRIFVKLIGNVHIAVICCAILFSATHFSYSGFIPRFFMGVILGYIYVSTGNVWYSVIFHFLNNALPITFYWLYANKIDLMYLNEFGSWGASIWVGLSLCVIALVFLLLYINRLINKPFVEDLMEN